MGWEYLFIVDFDADMPAMQRFSQIVEASHRSRSLGHLQPSQVSIGSDNTESSQISLGAKHSDPEKTMQMLRSLADQNRYIDQQIQIIYTRPLYVQMWDEEIPSKRPYPRRFILPASNDPLRESLPYAILYDAGDARHYRSGRTRVLNMEILLQELSFITSLAPRSIRGMNLNQDMEPHRHSVVYHRELDQYIEDIYHVTGVFYPKTERNREVVLDAIVSRNAGLRLAETDDLPILCSLEGTAGDLRSFYQTLLHLLEMRGSTQPE